MSAPAPAGRDRTSVARDVFAGLVLAGLGLLLATYAALLSPTGPRFGVSQPLSLGLVVAVVGLPLAVVLGMAATGRRLVAAVPVVVWALLVVAMGTRSAEGSVVLAGGIFQVSTTVVSFAGLLAGVLTLTLPPPWRARTRARTPGRD